MDSQRRLPRPWVCGSLELTACARRSSSSTWFSRREGPSAHFAPTFPMGHAFCLARLVMCFFFSLSSLRPNVRSKEHASLFCLLANISLRITWVEGGRAQPDTPDRERSESRPRKMGVRSVGTSGAPFHMQLADYHLTTLFLQYLFNASYYRSMCLKSEAYRYFVYQDA